jgi:hypothetical protein
LNDRRGSLSRQPHQLLKRRKWFGGFPYITFTMTMTSRADVILLTSNMTCSCPNQYDSGDV